MKKQQNNKSNKPIRFGRFTERIEPYWLNIFRAHLYKWWAPGSESDRDESDERVREQLRSLVALLESRPEDVPLSWEEVLP